MLDIDIKIVTIAALLLLFALETGIRYSMGQKSVKNRQILESGPPENLPDPSEFKKSSSEKSADDQAQETVTDDQKNSQKAQEPSGIPDIAHRKFPTMEEEIASLEELSNKYEASRSAQRRRYQ
ncbi:hypothetical protein L3Y34_016349 [Caenorhabditis briggsae]|uniref:Uncharacterized protein n=1 Tax=Caenorhabditis briggsae TaxID=6238 RepID=A0AAE9DW42_CAEBR|nr:hypothetical protein L3Y34_016349 [Caenorhabditis briggsae]